MDSTSKRSLDDIWLDDRLDRRDDALFLMRFLTNRVHERGLRGVPRCYVLNIDQSWGSGKTFFLNRFKQTLEHEGCLVAMIDAWRDDFAEDPLLSVMAAIDAAVLPLVGADVKVKRTLTSLKKTTQVVALAALKGLATQGARLVIGEAVDVIVDEVGLVRSSETGKEAKTSITDATKHLIDAKVKPLLDSFLESKRSMEKFKTQLAELLGNALDGDEEPRPMFILVDELDRCRPPYAIALLERVKHLFDIDNVVFVIATDTVQLSHAIGAVYGPTFDGGRYLGRFFDRSYSFEKVSREAFVGQLLANSPLPSDKISLPPTQKPERYLAGAFDFFGLSVRDVEQAYDIIRSAVTAWDLKAKVEMAVLVPMAIGFQQKKSPSDTSDFHRALKDLAAQNGGDQSAWEQKFVAHSRFDRTEEASVSGLALFNDFIAHSSKDLPALGEVKVTALYSRWVIQRLQEEFSVLHNSQWKTQSPPYSIIKQYAEFIRSAGRLKPE